MSKYFTKYIPVEGEIKEGDMIRHPTTGNVSTHFDGDGVHWINNHTDWKKVKLLLCSRDITLDDCVIKVIGEISPDAIWVKEGDEFEEDEVNIIQLPISKLNHVEIKCPTCGRFH